MKSVLLTFPFVWLVYIVVFFHYFFRVSKFTISNFLSGAGRVGGNNLTLKSFKIRSFQSSFSVPFCLFGLSLKGIFLIKLIVCNL